MIANQDVPQLVRDDAQPVVIVGSGLAGYTVARELRKLDRERAIVIVTQDDGSVYSKPTLSNALAMKKRPAALATADATAMAAQLNATVRTRQRVERILPDEHAVIVGGERIRYRQLVLATGADARRPRLEGNGAHDVLSINDLADYARFRGALEHCRSVAILGAGLIGCEFANDLALAGYAVTLIDPADAPLSRLMPRETGDVFAAALRASGVRFLLGRGVVSIELRQPGYRVTLADGTPLDADLVVSAIGLAPRASLAAEAGIVVDQGIVTDATCRTSAPDVYALGDCAAHEGKVRPYVLPIMHAARALAKTLAGEPTRVAFPVMPVVVKTPAAPTVVVTPSHEDGAWRIEHDRESAPHVARAICAHPEHGATIGFALVGATPASKAELLGTLTAAAPAA
jgi:rubredoxin---NAD+ reductase